MPPSRESGPDGEERPAGNAWDAAAYDGTHSFVFEYGADLLDRLEPREGERILDLGCGTGHLTGRIAGAGAAAVGVDRSGEMLATARAAHPGCRFVRGDARRLPVAGPFDAVFSNAVLHWIDDQDAVLGEVAGLLRPGGRLVAELGGTGNVAAIRGAVRAELAARGYRAGRPWYFPTVGEYAAALEGHGFEVRHARLFDRPTELEGGRDGLAAWLEAFGDGLLAPVPDDERPAVVSAVEARLRGERFEDGAWIADYRRLRVVAVLDR